MKKIIVLVQSKDIDPTLNALGEIGVLHIEHENAPINESVTTFKEKYESLTKAIRILPGAREDARAARDPEDLVSQILNHIKEKEALIENLRKIKKDIEAWKEWEDFDPRLIDALKDEGIYIRLCKLNKKELKNIPEGIILEGLFKKGNVSYCAIISRNEETLPFNTLSLPGESLHEMIAREMQEEDKIKEIDEKLTNCAKYKNILLSHKTKLESLIEFNKVTAGMGQFEKLSYLGGYCPVYNIDLLEKTAEKERWGILVEEPDENDNVPTLVKNPRWIEIVKPLFQMIKTVPGYREMDVSLWFLMFFSVFFGMLIGDAGYGAVFFIINLLCHIKFKHSLKDRSIFFLMYLLSVCAVIWGLLSGTFFGQAWLSKRVEPLLPFLRDNMKIQELCFLLGAFHLSIAHAWRLIRKLPSLKALSEVGWILMLWAACFLAKSLILSQEFPGFGKWFFIAGAGLIIFFTNPEKNIFKTIGSGIGNFLLNIINSFTDVVSYIRLFAVGAATVAVADAFNQMALDIGHSTIIMGFLTALVLLFGHTLNILLGAMAILVHGVRLNVLEFSSHLNMEWSGVEYAPFKHKGD
ncbi:V-type ATP synthase subunit I [Candidatus Omnitrophota bacterium]